MSTPKIGVEFTATGLADVRRGLKLVKDQAEPTGRQWGIASRQIAGGLEQIGRTGKVTGESLKSIISNGAEMAFMFGAGGPIVAALGIVGVAIYEGLTNRMKEARAEARKFAEEIAGVRRSGNLGGAADISQRLFSGDQFAVQREGESDREFQARQGGVLGIRARLQSLPKGPGGLFAAGSREADEARAWTALLNAYEANAAKAAAAVNELATAEGKRLVIAAAQNQDEFNRQFAALTAGGPITPSLGGLPGAYSMRGRFDRFGQVGSPVGIGKGRPEDNPATMAMVEGMKLAGEIAGNGFVDTLASTIEAGVSRVFQKGANIGTVFAAIGETALAGLGSIATQIGRAALTQFAFIKTIATAIAGLNPAVGIAASIALIAFGSALGGAGRRMGANASGGGGGFGGSYGSSSGYGSTIIDRGMIDPTRGAGVSARNPVYNNIVVIGPNDPVAQRQLQELMKGANGRGMV